MVNEYTIVFLPLFSELTRHDKRKCAVLTVRLYAIRICLTFHDVDDIGGGKVDHSGVVVDYCSTIMFCQGEIYNVGL